MPSPTPVLIAPTTTTGTAHRGAVPMPIAASAGPARLPIAAPPVANGTVAAIPIPPETKPTPEPNTPPAMPPTVAPAALIAAVADEPAATTPTVVAADPPKIADPITIFSEIDLNFIFNASLPMVVVWFELLLFNAMPWRYCIQSPFDSFINKPHDSLPCF